LPPKHIILGQKTLTTQFQKEKENPHHPHVTKPSPPPATPCSQSHLHSSATLHVTAYRRGNQLARRLSPPPAATKPHRISPLSLAAAYHHRLSRRGSPSTQLRLIGESAVLGLFLMENPVTNLLKYSIISYPSPSAPFNHPTEITVDSFFF
jgi:hypothetical protein